MEESDYIQVIKQVSCRCPTALLNCLESSCYIKLLHIGSTLIPYPNAVQCRAEQNCAVPYWRMEILGVADILWSIQVRGEKGDEKCLCFNRQLLVTTGPVPG